MLYCTKLNLTVSLWFPHRFLIYYFCELRISSKATVQATGVSGRVGKQKRKKIKRLYVDCCGNKKMKFTTQLINWGGGERS